MAMRSYAGWSGRGSATCVLTSARRLGRLLVDAVGEDEEVVEGGAHVGLRAGGGPTSGRVLWWPGEDGVLLEDVPPGIPALLQGSDDGGNVDVAMTQGDVHAVGD